MPVARAVLKSSDLGHSAFFSPHPVMTFLRNRVLMPALQLPAVRTALLDKVAELDVGYRNSSLVGETDRIRIDGDGETPGVVDSVRFRRGPHAGDRAPDARGRLDGTDAPVRLFDLFRGPHFTLLLFDGPASSQDGHDRLRTTARQVRAVLGDDVRVHVVVPADRRPDGLDDLSVLLDPDRDAHRRYGVSAEAMYLVRPDGYIAFRSQPAAAQPVLDHLSRQFTVRTTV